MRENDAPASAEPATYIKRIRLLSCEIEIRTNSRDLANRLSFLAQRAEQVMPLEQRSAVIITWTGEEFRISGDGVKGFELSVTSALETVFQALHCRAIAALADHVAIRAASGVRQNRSFLMVGAMRSGKSTLALRLLLEGFDMTGDELALLHQGNAVAFPRKFLLSEDSLAFIPGLAIFDRYRSPNDPTPGRLVAFDPLDFGKPWRIAPAPVSAIFYIEPNHGAQSILRPCGKVEMIRRIIPHCAAPNSGRRDWVGDLSATVDRAHTFVIELGDLDSAVTEIKRELS